MMSQRFQRAALGHARTVLEAIQRVLRFPYPNIVDFVEDGVYSRWITGLVFSVVFL